MKTIITFLLVFSFLDSIAQNPPPVINGANLPVKGTSVYEVWQDENLPNIPVPASGANHYWDYSTAFPNPYTFKIATFAPETAPTYSNIDSAIMARIIQNNNIIDTITASNASYLRTPVSAYSDSLYSYFKVVRRGGLYDPNAYGQYSTDGFYMMGGRSMKAMPTYSAPDPNRHFDFIYDTTFVCNNVNPRKPGELYGPANSTYLDEFRDTSF